MGHEQLASLLSDTVMLLCKNGLQFQSRLKIEGLIGVTVDSTVFLIHLNEEILDQSGNALLCQENTSDDRFSTGFNKNQSKPVENTSKPVVTRNIASIQKKESSPLGVKNTKIKHPKIETKSLEHEAVDSIGSDGDVAEASNDCTVICETQIKQEVNENVTTKMFRDRYSNQSGELLCQRPKETVNRNERPCILPAISCTTSVSTSNFSVEYLTPSSGYTVNSSTPIPFSSMGRQAHSISANSSYRQDGKEWTEMDVNKRSFTAITPYGRKRQRFGTPGTPHNNFKRADASLKKSGSNAFVLTQSLHICAYPMCGKQFQHKHHLLRHQTRKHGREPIRNRRTYDYDTYPYTSTQEQSLYMDEENAYDENYDIGGSMSSMHNRPVNEASSTSHPPGDVIDKEYSSETGALPPFVVSSGYCPTDDKTSLNPSNKTSINPSDRVSFVTDYDREMNDTANKSEVSHKPPEFIIDY